MDDATTLRLKKIEANLQVAQTLAQLQSRTHVAVLAVALASGGSVALAAAAGQVPWLITAAAEAVAAVAAAGQIMGLRATGLALRETALQVMQDIDSLKASEGEPDVDDPAPHREP